MIKRTLPYYYFSMECILLYASLFLLYMPRGQHPPVGAFLIMLLLANITLHVGLRQSSNYAAFLLLGGLVSASTAYILGLGPISSLFSVFFLFGRIYAFIKDHTLWKRERAGLAIIFYLICLVLISDSWVVDYNEINVLYCLPIGFTIFYSAGRYMQQMEHQHQHRFLLSFLGAISIAAVVTWVFTIILPYVKWAFFGLLQGLILIISFMATPVLNMFGGKQLELKVIHAPKDNEDQGSRNKIIHRMATYLHLAQIPGWIWLVLLTLIFLTIFIILRGKKVKRGEGNDSLTFVEFEHIPLLTEKMKFPFFRQRAPQEHLRKLFFDLHQLAAKNKMGRFSNETVREWFDRIGLPKDENLFLAYEKIRYGNESMSNTEGAQYDPIFEELKHKIRNGSEKKNDIN